MSRENVSWDAFLAVREQDRRAALLAAARLGHGELGEAARTFDTWRFARWPELSQSVLSALSAAPPRPTGAAMARALAPGERLPRCARAQAPWLHRVWLGAQALPELPADEPELRVAWGLMALRGLGRDVQDRLRAPWRRQELPPDPRDAELPAMWTAIRDRKSWGHLCRWQEYFQSTAEAAIRGVLDACGWPRGDWDNRVAVEGDNFLLRLLGDGAGAGWRAVAARVVETGPEAPLTALASALDGAAWSQVARCAVVRGHGTHTAMALWPDVSRVRVLIERVADWSVADTARLEALAELHAAQRLVSRWSEGAALGDDELWRVTSQNLGRARGRLRAVLRDLPGDELIRVVLTRDRLYHRTRLAVARAWRDVAWRQLHTGWAGDIAMEIEPGCDERRPPVAPASDDRLAATWVLLCVLRGHTQNLIQWAAHGKGISGGGWGRMLTTDAPEALRPTADAEGLWALRVRVVTGLRARLRALLPVVRAVAALDPGASGLAAALHAAIAPVWHEAIPKPAARQRQIVAHATAALPLLIEEVGP